MKLREQATEACKNVQTQEKASQIGLSEAEIGFRSEKLLLLKIYSIVVENKALI